MLIEYYNKKSDSDRPGRGTGGLTVAGFVLVLGLPFVEAETRLSSCFEKRRYRVFVNSPHDQHVITSFLPISVVNFPFLLETFARNRFMRANCFFLDALFPKSPIVREEQVTPGISNWKQLLHTKASFCVS